MSIPDPFGERSTYHVNIHTGPTVEEILTQLREKYASPTIKLRDRISTLEALTDQLAKALIHHIGWTGDCRCDGDMDEDCPTDSALRAYEADKEAHR